LILIDEDLDEQTSMTVPEENYIENSEQLEVENQKHMLLISLEEEKQKKERMLAIESDVKNVERDMQDIQDLFRDLSKLVNVCMLQIFYLKTYNYVISNN
jgi:hypothetical protein